jgi:hypothetical protein
VNPETQIVFLMLSCVTEGFIIPGVHFGSGRSPFTTWHPIGIVELDDDDDDDDCNGAIIDILLEFWRV